MSKQSTALVKDLRSRKEEVTGFLMERLPLLNQVAPKHFNSERMVRMAIASSSRNPDLLRCTNISWLLASLDSCFYGLEPNAQLGHAYLIPYKNKHRGGALEVNFQVGYKGLILLVCETGHVYDVDAEIVYAGDRFAEYKQQNPPFMHEPTHDTEKRGEIVGAYAVGWREEPKRPKFKYLIKADVEKYRARSRASGSNFWTKDWDAMAKKTAVRRLVSLIPTQPGSRLGMNITQENLAEQGHVVYTHRVNERGTDLEQNQELDVQPDLF